VKIGVLALQGDFAEHIQMLKGLGVATSEVRLAADLEDLNGLIIPGGESTTIGKLATTFGLMEPLRQFGLKNAVWGTCAGAIFIAKEVQRDQPILNLMDISIERNAFGRQVDSFETELRVDSLEDPARPFRAVFIRAPLIEDVGNGVEVIAKLNSDEASSAGQIVAARQDRLLATAFHPELTADDRFHKFFLSMVNSA
jgi:5'-phosphate synthase pdxT subunit